MVPRYVGFATRQRAIRRPDRLCAVIPNRTDQDPAAPDAYSQQVSENL